MRPRLVALTIVFAVLCAACGSAAPVATQPGPDAPCGSADPAAAGYYPQLEAKVPASWQGHGPSSVKSGRYCSATTLGSLQAKGIHEIRYAGKTWLSSDGEASLAMVTYEAPALTPSLLADEFERAAREGRGTSAVSRSDVTVDGRPGIRLDVLLTSSREARVVWPSADGTRVNAVIGSGVTDDAIASAEVLFGS